MCQSRAVTWPDGPSLDSKERNTVKNTIRFKMTPALASALGQQVKPEGIYALSLIALVGLLAARFGFKLSMQAFEREHITTRLASAAAWGVLERETAANLAFALGGFFTFDRPESMDRKDVLIWLAAVFKVYFDIRFSGGLLSETDPEDVRSWARVLLDSEILGLGSLPDSRTRQTAEDPPWSISTVAIHLMASRRAPDVYPKDLIPTLEVAPEVLESVGAQDTQTVQADSLLAETSL